MPNSDPINLDEIRDSLGMFYLTANAARGYTYVPYQQEKIIPLLEDVADGRNDRVMIWQHPGSAKSEITTRTFVPYFLGRFPAKNVMVLSYSADLASDDFGANIKATMESDLYTRIFPGAKLTRDSRSKTYFKTISGGNFWSAGIHGGITGKRLDLVVCDDLIKNDEEAGSEMIQEKLFNAYKVDLKDRMRPGGSIVICNHRWRTRDICGRILELDGEKSTGGKWTVLKLKAEDPEGSGNYLWAEHYGAAHYADFKKDPDTWNSKWQQEPNASLSFWFREEWLNFYDIPIPPKRYNTYMFVDPAASKNKKSDRTCIIVLAAGQDKKIFLVDLILDRLDPRERTDAIMRTLRRWHPEVFLYEQYGLLNDEYYIREMLSASEWSGAYPIGVGKSGPRHNMSKWERIKQLVPLFREGRFFLPRSMKRKLIDGQIVDMTKWFIDNEYTLAKGEGSIKHEDILDCLSRVFDLDGGPEAMEFAAPTEDREVTPHYRSHATGWESAY